LQTLHLQAEEVEVDCRKAKMNIRQKYKGANWLRLEESVNPIEATLMNNNFKPIWHSWKG
jgi:hypothetical protein